MDIEFDIDSWLQKRTARIRRQIISGEISDLELQQEYPDAFMCDFEDDVFPLLLQQENDKNRSATGQSIEDYIDEAKKRNYFILQGYPTIVDGQHICVFEKESLSYIMEDISGQWYLFSSKCTSPDITDFEYERWAVNLSPFFIFDFLDRYISFTKFAVKKWKEFYWAQEDCWREIQQQKLLIAITRRTLDEILGKKLIEMAVPCNIYCYGNDLCLCVQIGKDEVAHGKISINEASQVLSILRDEDINYREELFKIMGFDLFPSDLSHTLSFEEYNSRINVSI